MSVMRNTLGKEQVPQDSGRPISDEALRDYCDRNYHQILPIIAENVHQEKVQQKKLKAVKARLNFEDTLRHSKSETISRRRGLKERLRPRHARSMSGSLEPRRDRSKPPRERGPDGKTNTREIQGIGHTTTFPETLKAATEVLAPEKQNLLLRNIITKEHPREEQKNYWKARVVQEDIESQGRRGKSHVLKTTCPNRGEVGHTNDECMHLKRQIEEMIKAGKLSHLIKEIKQSGGKDQKKAAKTRKTSGKEKPLAILMVTISIQRNNREARSKENSSSTIYSSRNAKILSGRRNSHITEQYDYSIRMKIGLGT
nr:reverse transcriptase domain-containing protein [Tanacetum cinerariifolium]